MKPSPTPSSPSHRLTAIAWAVILLVSILPNILFQEISGSTPDWLFWAKLGLLAVLAGIALAWRSLRPLLALFGLIMVLYLAEWLFHEILANTLQWQAWFPEATYANSMLGTQLLRLGATLVVMAFLLGLKRRPAAFFFTIGRLDAVADPIPGLMKEPNPWTKLGRTLAFYISLGTLAFLVVAARPAPAVLLKALPLLPAVLLFAVMNAFSEEMSYRASFLSIMEGPLGKRHTLWMTAAFFGIGHYYGVPYGLVGVLMAGFLGWLLGKAMLETRGFFWAWFIHFPSSLLWPSVRSPQAGDKQKVRRSSTL